MINLFTYGSLMCSDIMFTVADCRLKNTRAVLNNFFRSAIRDEEYPGIIPRRNAAVEGVLYLALSPEAIERLDAFEGEFYFRGEVEVVTKEGGCTPAMTYIIKPEYRNLLSNRIWSFDHFLSEGKKKFTASYFGFDDVDKGKEE